MGISRLSANPALASLLLFHFVAFVLARALPLDHDLSSGTITGDLKYRRQSSSSGSSSLSPSFEPGDGAPDPGEFTNDLIPNVEPIAPSAWRSANGNQFPMATLKRAALNGLWAEALEKGKLIKDFYEHYVFSHTGRLVGQPQPANIDDHYTFRDQAGDADRDLETIAQPLADIGLADAIHVDWHTVEVESKVQPANYDEDHAMQDFAMNVEKGYIITLDQYPAQDGNAEADRLKTSELAWQMWHKAGGDHSGPKYWLQYLERDNAEANNIVTMAHDRFPGRVTDIKDVPGYEHQYRARWGRGTWYPPTAAYDTAGDVFTRLMNTAEVKTIARMLVDHNDGLDYPAITEIHTQPTIDDAGSGPGQDWDRQYGYIIVKFGKVPGEGGDTSDSSGSSGSMNTSPHNSGPGSSGDEASTRGTNIPQTA